MENQPNENVVYSNQDIPFLYDNFVVEVDELISLAHYGPGLILVIGSQGMGKTKILQQFETEITDAGIIGIDGSPMLTIDQLFASILQQLQALNRTIEFDNTQQAIIEASEDIDQVILVDDASQLSAAVLESLIRLIGPISSTPEFPIRLILSGEEDLISQIAELSLVPSNAIFPLHLNGLEKDEVAGFLGHQLNLSRQSVEDNYGEKRLKKLWKNAEGNPGELLKSLHQSDEVILKNDNSGSSPWIKTGLVLFGIALLFLAVFGDSWWTTDNPSSEAKTTGDIILDIQPGEHKPSKIVSSFDKKTSEISEADQENVENKPKTLELNDQLKPENKVPAQDISLKNENVDTESQLTQSLTEEKVLESTNKERSDAGDQTGNPIKVNPPVSASLPPEKPADNLEAKVEREKIENKADIKKFTIDENWLLQQSPESYMIQFVGLSSDDSIEKFVKSYRIPLSVKIYRSRLNDKPWLILVGGLFADVDSARKTRDNLGDSLKKLQPWVKSVRVIQKEIQQAASYR